MIQLEYLPSRNVSLWQDSQENIVTVSANYTAKEKDDYILVSATSANVTITLPRTRNGKKFWIQKVAGSYSVFVVATDGTINEASSYTLPGTFHLNYFKAEDGNYIATGIPNHNSAQNIQGGSSNQYYHLTSDEYVELQRLNNVTEITTDITLSLNEHTVYATVDALTVTLPAASLALVGRAWQVVLAVAGGVTVAPNGADVILLPTSDTTVTIYGKGSSLTFKCLTSTSWGIV